MPILSLKAIRWTWCFLAYQWISQLNEMVCINTSMPVPPSFAYETADTDNKCLNIELYNLLHTLQVIVRSCGRAARCAYALNSYVVCIELTSVYKYDIYFVCYVSFLYWISRFTTKPKQRSRYDIICVVCGMS